MKLNLKSSLAVLLSLVLLFSSCSIFEPLYADSVANPSSVLTSGYEQLDVMIKGIKENYYKEVTDEVLLKALYKGVFDALDPHSTYFTPQEYSDFSQSVSGSFIGIGVTIEPKNGFIEVVAPFIGSPAEKAGIKAGDIITAVDGKTIKDMGSDLVVNLIRGKEGTAVTLTLERPGLKTPLTIKVVRAKIDIVSASYKLVNGIDVITLTGWDDNTLTQLEAILKKSSLKKGLIVDVRNNPGGLLSQVVDISSLFLKKDQTIVTIDYANYSDEVYKAPINGLTVPMAVLVNGSSASASEIFAAAMQDHGRAKIIGTQTYGKGTVQSLFNLPDQGAMKLTIASYLTPKGISIHGIGVKPDFIVDNADESTTLVANFLPVMSLVTVKRGDKNLEVKGAQQRLAYLGYKVVADGSFGTATLDAVKAFQKAKGLSVSGLIDEKTKIALVTEAQNLGKTHVVDKQMEKALSLFK